MRTTVGLFIPDAKGKTNDKTEGEYGQLNGEDSSCMRYILDYEKTHPEMSRFLDMRYGAVEHKA